MKQMQMEGRKFKCLHEVKLTGVSFSAMWIAVCVCSVTAPVRIRDVPFASAMKMMS